MGFRLTYKQLTSAIRQVKVKVMHISSANILEIHTRFEFLRSFNRSSRTMRSMRRSNRNWKYPSGSVDQRWKCRHQTIIVAYMFTRCRRPSRRWMQSRSSYYDRTTTQLQNSWSPAIRRYDEIYCDNNIEQEQLVGCCRRAIEKNRQICAIRLK